MRWWGDKLKRFLILDARYWIKCKSNNTFSIQLQSLPGCLPELKLVSARELGQAEPEGRGNLISEDFEACYEVF